MALWSNTKVDAILFWKIIFMGDKFLLLGITQIFPKQLSLHQ